MSAIAARRRTLPGFGLTMGLTLSWLSIIILIPLAGLFLKSLELSPEQFWNILSSRRTLNALRVSFGLAFAAREKLVFAGDYTGRILVWPLEGEPPQPLQTWQAHTGWCRALALSPDGKSLASCGNDRLVKLWSIPDRKPIRTLAGHESHVYNVAFHPTQPLLVSVGFADRNMHFRIAMPAETIRTIAKSKP